MNMNTKLVKGLFYGFSALLTGVLAFFIIDLSSYEKGKEILTKNYNVEF
jgi:hypothetical protein